MPPCGDGRPEPSRKEHDAAVTHVQCLRAHTCQRAARASLVHVRHWECVHACDCVCAAVVSVSSAVSFFADGITAGGYTPRPGAAFRPGHSLP